MLDAITQLETWCNTFVPATIGKVYIGIPPQQALVDDYDFVILRPRGEPLLTTTAGGIQRKQYNIEFSLHVRALNADDATTNCLIKFDAMETYLLHPTRRTIFVPPDDLYASSIRDWPEVEDDVTFEGDQVAWILRRMLLSYTTPICRGGRHPFGT